MGATSDSSSAEPHRWPVGRGNWWRMRRWAAANRVSSAAPAGLAASGKEREHGLVCGGAHRRLRALSRGCVGPALGSAGRTSSPLTASPCRGSLTMSHMTRAPPHATSSEAMPTWRAALRSRACPRLPVLPCTYSSLYSITRPFQECLRISVSFRRAHHLQCSDPSLNGLLSHFPSFRYDRLCSVSFLE